MYISKLNIPTRDWLSVYQCAYIHTNTSHAYTYAHVCVHAERKQTCTCVCLYTSVYFHSVRVWGRQTHNQISSESGGKRCDCSWLWVWQQMFYTNPARCIQSVSMVMESVIVELQLSPLLFSQQGRSWRWIWTPLRQLPGPLKEKKIRWGGGNDNEETQRQGTIIFPIMILKVRRSS